MIAELRGFVIGGFENWRMKMKTKVKPSDTGKFVTVYFTDTGKQDGILLDVIGEDDCRVYFPHTSNDGGGIGSNAIVGSNQIVAIGPESRIEIPLFG